MKLHNINESTCKVKGAYATSRQRSTSTIIVSLYSFVNDNYILSSTTVINLHYFSYYIGNEKKTSSKPMKCPTLKFSVWWYLANFSVLNITWSSIFSSFYFFHRRRLFLFLMLTTMYRRTMYNDGLQVLTKAHLKNPGKLNRFRNFRKLKD